MTDGDSDRRDWLLQRPLARQVVDSAELDAPPEGLEARLVEGLRAAREEPTFGNAEAGVVSAADDVHPDLLLGAPASATSKTSKKTAPTRLSQRLIRAAIAAAAAAAVFVTWALRERAIEPERKAFTAQTADVPVAVPSAQTREPGLCNPAVRADPSALTIDDFEDGNARMLVRGGRFGSWNYVTVDGRGEPEVDPLKPDRVNRPFGSGYALHAMSGRRHDWQAVWAAFGPPCYDASSFVGLRFKGKGPVRLTFELRMVDDIERAKGGACDADCYHSHGTPVALGRAFEQRNVLFSSLAQSPDTPETARRPFDARRLTALAFVVDPKERRFEFWIDDVEWIRQ